MIDSKGDLEELKALQRDLDAMRRRSKAAKTDPNPVDVGVSLDSTDALSGEEAEEILNEDWSDQIGGLVSELEEAAVGHPALALLAAFGAGVIVGNLINRK